MKKILYTMELLSSLIITPRAGQALYKGIDDFFVSPDIQTPDKADPQKIAIVYPFYQYGEYKTYDPENTEYYLPGSSIKGAFLREKKEKRQCMADDVVVPHTCIVLRNLWKAQFLENEDIIKAKFDFFFENVGIEMMKDGTKLCGELYLDETISVSEFLKIANDDTKLKMKQMCNYIQILLEKEYSDTLKNNLRTIKQNLSSLLTENNIILLGGYKGILHSMIIRNTLEMRGGLLIDKQTLLPHGLVKIDFDGMQ